MPGLEEIDVELGHDDTSKSPFVWKQLTQRCGNPKCTSRQVFSRRKHGISIKDRWYCGGPCFASIAEEKYRDLLLNYRPSEAVRKNRIPLGLTLISRGSLQASQLAQALNFQRSLGGRLGDIVQTMGFVSEEEVTAALAQQSSHPLFSSKDWACDLRVQIPLRFIEAYSMMPIHFAMGTQKLLLGFCNGVEHRVLGIVEAMLGCSASACWISQTKFGTELRRIKEYKQTAEIIFESMDNPWEMARIAQNYGLEVKAHSARFARCNNAMWTRLSGESQELDLLFGIARS